jgi:hypothetical protein
VQRKIRVRIAFVPAFALAACATLAYADIYTWTDARGTTVISDTPPADPDRIADLQVVVREPPTSAKRSGARDATPTERKLLERIDNLERRLAERTYSAPPSTPPAPAPAVTYSTSPPPPGYSYDAYYYDYSPPYAPTYYAPSYSYVVPGAVFVSPGFRGRRFVGHHAFPHRGGFAHRGRR